MNYEIEAKAWVSESELAALKGRLASCAEYLGSLYKEDQYWAPRGSADGDELIRIRFLSKNASSAVVTKKSRSFLNEVEVNQEEEFSVDPAESFLHILPNLGYSYYISKVKVGEHYTMDDAHIELCRVEGLGWFLEIEVIVPEKADAARRQAVADGLMALFKRLGIGKDAIETRYYIDLLRKGEDV